MSANDQKLNSLLELISKEISGYKPSSKTAKILGGTTLVPIIGPFAVGKTTSMKLIERADPDFKVVKSFTTRPRRPNEEDNYNFLPNNIDSLEYILESLMNQSLVQVAIHPSTNYIYGSIAENYTSKYSLLDTLSNAMQTMYNLPFGNVREVALVTPPTSWQKRIERSDQYVDNQDKMKRLNEALICLKWLLENDRFIPWVVNEEGDQASAVKEIIAIVRENYKPQVSNKKIGEDLLKYASTLSA